MKNNTDWKYFVLGLCYALALGWILFAIYKFPRREFYPCVGVEKDGSFSAYCKQEIDMYQATMSGGLRIDK